MIKKLIFLLLITFAAQAQVTVLVSKNFRGNTLPGAYRQGGIVEVRPDRVDTVYTQIDSVTIDTSIVVTPHPIGTKEPTAFYILRVSDGDFSDSLWVKWTEVDTVSPPQARGRRVYRLRANYLNTLDTYDTLTFVDFTDKVIPKDQGFLHGYEEPQPERWAGIKLEVPLWIRRLMPAVATSATVNPDGGGADYTSLNAAESGEQKDLVTATETLTINCTSDGTADATATSFAGWTTDATYFPTVNGENQSATTVGIWDDTIYRLSVALNSATGIDVSIADMTINNMQVAIFSAGPGYGIGIGNLGGTTLNVNNCIIKNIYSGAALLVALSMQSGTTNVKNCIIYDFDLSTATNTAGYRSYTPGVGNVYNCTSYDNNKGYFNESGTFTVINSIDQESPDGFSGSFEAASNYNMSDIAADAPGANSLNSTSATFENEAGDDFRLAAGSEGIDDGTTIAGVTTAIDGTARPQGSAYDMGAFEFVAAAAAATSTKSDSAYHGWRQNQKYKHFKKW